MHIQHLLPRPMGTYLSRWGGFSPAGEPDHALQDNSKHIPSAAATYTDTWVPRSFERRFRTESLIFEILCNVASAIFRQS